jgi:hypothetical protein
MQGLGAAIKKDERLRNLARHGAAITKKERLTSLFNEHF